MYAELYEKDQDKIRPLLGALDGTIADYKRAVHALADACTRCPDKPWVDHVLTWRLIQHKGIGHMLEASMKKAGEEP